MSPDSSSPRILPPEAAGALSVPGVFKLSFGPLGAMPTDSDPIIVPQSFVSADDFIDTLAARNRRWENRAGIPARGDWWFRGQSNASLLLLPKAFREDVQFVEDGAQIGARKTGCDQVIAEANALLTFFDVCDEQGLPLPDDTQRWRTLYHDTLRNKILFAAEEQRWPLPEVIGVAALAQHHGIPTRFLDWTTSAYTAAYFAAREAAVWCHKPDENERGATHILVAAFHDLLFQARAEDETTILPVMAAAAGNPNLAAQRGKFTCVSYAKCEPDDPPRIEDFENVVERVGRKAMSIPQYGYKGPFMYRFTLPIGEAPRLLRLLRHEGVSAANLFPGYDGVGRSIDERRYYDDRLPKT